MFPALTFFKPNDTFVQWMHESDFLRYRRIIDAGAGVGAMAACVNKGKRHKLNIVSIDRILRDKYDSPVQIADATRFDFGGCDALFICRPCHSDWIDHTYINAIKSGVEDMFYVGLVRNVDEDLFEFGYELVLANVGEDGENLYRVFGRREDVEDYVLVKATYEFHGDFWAKLRGVNGEMRAYNQSGGYQPISPERILATKKAMSIAQIERPTAASYDTGHKYSAKDKPYGWLAPDGRIYCCDEMDHDSMIYDAFGIDSLIEREQNWVKLQNDDAFPSDWDKEPNIHQKRVLKELGYD